MVRYRPGKRSQLLCAALVACVWLSGPRSAADDDVAAHSGKGSDAAAGRASTPVRAKSHEAKAAPHVSEPPLDVQAALAHGHREGAKWTASAGAERRVELTIAPGLQQKAEDIFEQYRVPYAAVAAIEPSTGRLLAYVGHEQEGNHGDPVRDASPPAASVFKIITAAALVDAGVKESTRTCYCGGSSRLDLVNLKDDPRRDLSCATLDEALGKSLNAVFAKLADKHLDSNTLLRYAKSFGFGQVLPFDFAPAASPIEVPGERLEFARTAAGFWHAFMSPLHAALIAATFANDGNMPRPRLIERVVLPDGKVQPAPGGGTALRAVISPKTAHAVGKMMLRTCKDGTSRTAFLDGRGRAQLPGIQVAGKTGSLSANDPYRAYSWWVGFAPAEAPRIAVAALIVNGPVWRIKSSFLAREVLREYLLGKSADARVAVRRKR
jgi:cell division protein FtsI/penicillin-binding protein 2